MAQKNALLWQIASALKTWQQPSLGQSFFLDDVSRPAVFARQKHWSGRMILLWLRSCPCWKLCSTVLCYLQSSMSTKKNHRSITLMTEWTHHASPVLPMSNLNCLFDRIIHPPGIARVMTPGQAVWGLIDWGMACFLRKCWSPKDHQCSPFFWKRWAFSAFGFTDFTELVVVFFTWHDWLVLSGWVITTNHRT